MGIEIWGHMLFSKTLRNNIAGTMQIIRFTIIGL